MHSIQVLDKGFVALLEVMGDDSMIVKAARISTGQTLKTPEEDAKLIRYLVKNRHTSPLEMVVFLFHIKLPIFVMRQLVRHRTARLNEYSARYSEMPDDYYIPTLDRIKGQGKMNKQGSEGELSDVIKFITQCAMQEASKQSYLTYQAMLANGVSRELARIILPVNFYTEIYWQMDLNNLAKLVKLRSDGHAQWEIQEYSNALAGLVKERVPVAWEAIEKFELGEKD